MPRPASFSSIQTYKKCPAQYNYKYNLGMKDDRPPGPAALRGTAIHNSIEDHYNFDSELHEEIPPMLVAHITEHKGKCEDVRPEMKFAFTRDWEPCDFDDEEAYVRGFMDNVFVYPDRIVVHEYKTGQEYPEHEEQKALYGMACLILFPDYEEVVVEGVYIDKKYKKTSTYNRLQLMSMKFMWQKDIDKLQFDIFPARPGQHCRWCPASKLAGGPCKVG